jgi:UDP-glucose 4-epimerase
MQNKILVTGGAGYIGSHIAVALLDAGYNIVVIDNLCNSKRDVVKRIELVAGKHFIFVEGDIRDKTLIMSILKDYKIDAVIHLAGLKSVSDSVSDPLAYYDNNVVGSLMLLEAMQEIGIKKMVFSSSATVYGEPQYIPIDESHPVNAINPYGCTKLHIEKMLQNIAASDSGWGAICLRYFNPVGAHDSGLLGEEPKGIPNNLVPYLLKVISGDLPSLNIYGTDYKTIDGTGVRDYIDIVDLAEGHLAALNYLSFNNGWEAINLGTGKGVSVLELVNEFEVVLGRKIPYKHSARRAGDVSISFADVSKAKKKLNWVSKRTLHNVFENLLKGLSL